MMSAERPPRKSGLRGGLVTILLLAYSGVVLVVTLSPSQMDQAVQNGVVRLLAALHRNGLPESVGYGEIEFLANIAMFVPLGFMGALLFSSRWSWLALVGGAGFSVAVENIQRVFLAERVYSEWDIVANTMGALLGLIAAETLRSIVHRRDRRVIERALWFYERGLPIQP